MSGPHQEVPRKESASADATLPAFLGTVAWGVALVVLVSGDRVTADRSWWITTCLVGFWLGVFGLGFALRRRAAYRAARAADQA